MPAMPTMPTIALTVVDTRRRNDLDLGHIQPMLRVVAIQHKETTTDHRQDLALPEVRA
jgi:hypothetical protein